MLEEKLAIILAEFGVDKTADVLDSAQAEDLFDDLFRTAILTPQELVQKVDEVARQVQEQALAGTQGSALLGSQGVLEAALARQALDTPLPYWLERMTLAYLQSEGGRFEQQSGVYRLHWPDVAESPMVVFNAGHAQRHPAAKHLTLQDERLRALIVNLAPVTPGQPIPCGVIPGMPANLQGTWSLWRIRLIHPTGSPNSGADFQMLRMLPLFVNNKGRTFLPTGHAIWDQLLTQDVQDLSWIDGERTTDVYAQARQAAEAQGQPIYQQLLHEYQTRQAQEHDKALYSFTARRKSIERVGLLAVRQHRLERIEAEQRQWEQAERQRPIPLPELEPILILAVKGSEKV